MNTDGAGIFVEGPWEHRLVPANGARFHVAELGQGPMVLLLHGFPEFWWAWRAQLPALAEAGYRAVAMDLRGYGGSDKPPHGYDTFTLAADAASVIRSLGAEDAVVVGHGWGGWIGWSMPSMQPAVTRAVAALGMPHPLAWRRASYADPAQVRANGYLAGLQRPFVPERRLSRNSTYVEGFLRRWAAPDGGWPPPDVVERYAHAMGLPFVAHSAAEYYRWLVRSQLRSDGRRFVNRLHRAVRVPVLQLHGEQDGAFVPSAAAGSGGYVTGPFNQRFLRGAGHFLPEEAPDEVNRRLVDWLGALPR